MTYKQFRSMLESIGLPVAYSSFTGTQSLPFICFLQSDESSGSDLSNEMMQSEYTVELYSQLQYDGENIEKIKNMFDSRGVKYSANYGIYIQDEDMFLSRFEVSFYYKK